MDAGIADTINRRDVTKIVARLDGYDVVWNIPQDKAWYRAAIADTLMSDADATRSDRAWLVGILAHGIPGIAFDGAPADCDWDNLFSHFRDEILARRDPQTPLVCAAESPRGMV